MPEIDEFSRRERRAHETSLRVRARPKQVVSDLVCNSPPQHEAKGTSRAMDRPYRIVRILQPLTDDSLCALQRHRDPPLRPIKGRQSIAFLTA
jgi:hypothetical protein